MVVNTLTTSKVPPHFSEFWALPPLSGCVGLKDLSIMANNIMFIAEVKGYRTKSELAKGKYSIGMTVATSLNGDSDWVGSFNPNANSKARWTGFLTNRRKFDSKKEMKASLKELRKRFPVGSTMPSTSFAWGELNVEATQLNGSDGQVEVHYVDFVDSRYQTELEDSSDPAEAKEPAKKEESQDTPPASTSTRRGGRGNS